MAAERRTRRWWQGTVARWKRSGLTANAFAAREGVAAGTLLGWSSRLNRDIRAEHGSSAVQAIEIVVPEVTASSSRGLEIAVGDVVVRCEVGVDVAYVAALVRALAGG
jgi:hypothetical protein